MLTAGHTVGHTGTLMLMVPTMTVKGPAPEAGADMPNVTAWVGTLPGCPVMVVLKQNCMI